MKYGFKKTKGWEKLERLLTGNEFTPTVKKHLMQATLLNAKIAEKFMRDSIKSGKFKKNEALTIAIKQSTKPLVDKGAQLYGSITSLRINDEMVFVGVLKKNEIYNIAVAIHEGVSIRVTQKMRNMFLLLSMASNGEYNPQRLTGRAKELWGRMQKNWYPLSPSTTKIKIPKRDFAHRVFKMQQMKNIARDNWTKALTAAFKELAR